MRKMVVLVLILTVALRTPIPAVLAQDVPAVEEGTKADREVSRAVVAAAKDLIKKINDGDPTAVEGLSEGFRSGLLRTMDVLAGFEALRSFTPGPFKVVKTYDVRYLTDGRFTLQIAFTGGFGLEHQYSTQRWVLVQIGETYLLDTWYPGKKFVPDDWTQQEVAVNLSGGALALADGSISLETEMSDVIFLSITTTDAQAPIGLYRLNEGAAPVAGLAADSGELYGILSADASVVLDYGFADVEPGQYALVVLEPGGVQLIPAAWSTPLSIVVTEPQGAPTP